MQQQHTDTLKQHAATASTAGAVVIDDYAAWLRTKLQMMDCLLMIKCTKELERWNNHLCKNMRITDRRKIKEIALMVSIRRDQLNFKKAK